MAPGTASIYFRLSQAYSTAQQPSAALKAVEGALALERELQQQLFASGDAKEGIAAYVEKRKAEFKGK